MTRSETETRSEALVAFGPARPRRDALRLATELARDGVPSVLVPALGRPGAFEVAVPPARVAALPRGQAGPRLGAYRAACPTEEEALPQRARRLAAFFALGLGFGLGHLYARETVAALILALAQLACLALAALGIGAALWAVPALLLLDAVGAIGAVDRENDGQRRDGSLQLAATLPVVALVVAAATVLVHGATGEADARGAAVATAGPR